MHSLQPSETISTAADKVSGSCPAGSHKLAWQRLRRLYDRQKHSGYLSEHGETSAETSARREYIEGWKKRQRFFCSSQRETPRHKPVPSPTQRASSVAGSVRLQAQGRGLC